MVGAGGRVGMCGLPGGRWVWLSMAKTIAMGRLGSDHGCGYVVKSRGDLGAILWGTALSGGSLDYPNMDLIRVGDGCVSESDLVIHVWLEIPVQTGEGELPGRP